MNSADSLNSVLQVRQRERDLVQQSAATARQEVSLKQNKRNLFLQRRESLLEELRAINNADMWDVAAVLERQEHAKVLAADIEQAEAELNDSQSRLRICLEALLNADQSVRAVEKVIGRRVEQHRQSREKLANREYDDTNNWRHFDRG